VSFSSLLFGGGESGFGGDVILMCDFFGSVRARCWGGEKSGKDVQSVL